MSRSTTLAAIDHCLSVSDSPADIELTRQAIRDPGLDWLAVMALANEHLVAPALWTTLARPEFRALVPEDVQRYLTLLSARNAARNARIRQQCLGIGSILARAGLRAALLKGAAWLFDGTSPSASDRMMGDIDLAVVPEDFAAAVRALAAVGYRDVTGFFLEVGHIHHAPMVCQGAEATVEIHRDLFTQVKFLPTREVIASAREVAPGLLLPACRHRIIHNVIHAQIANGDFAAGVVSLRDGLDLARLVGAGAGELDWSALALEARDRGYFRYLSGAIHGVHEILGSPCPPPFAHDRLGRLHAWRCVRQRRWPRIGKPLEKLGLLARALAWERDAYALGLPQRRSLRAQILVNGRRARRSIAALRRNFHWRRGAPAKSSADIAQRELERLDEAVARSHEQLASTPDDAAACFKLGLSLRALKRDDEAANWFRRACDLRPDHAGSARELGDALAMLKRNEEAIAAYRHALSLQPDSIPTLLRLGERLQECGQFAEAAETFAKVVELDPNHAIGWFHAGGALLGARRYAEALAAVERTIALEPGSAPAHCNLGLALMGLDRLEEALKAFRKVLLIEAGSPVATFNLACALLALGNFRDGWEAYDYRFVMGGNKWLRPEAHAAPWVDETLAGKSILVLGEQGNGDHIQFSRYATALSDLGASVSYLAPERLHRLFSTLRGSVTLLSEIPPDARFDFQCPLISLPGRFERQSLPIPTRVPYLAPEPERVARWQRRTGAHGFRVGIIWRGNRHPNGDGMRSFPLAALRALAALPGVRLISLQLKDGLEELENLPADMRVELLDADFDAGEDAFLDSAAVMEVVDLVISCDTSMAHLAGALGRPVWIALNHIPEWRWQRRGSESVWYPTARLFRQEAHGDWDGVFSRMAAELAQLLQAGASSFAARLDHLPPAPGARAGVGQEDRLGAMQKNSA
jgi:tetratricopeptide (TPR) repeat protein